MSTWFLSEFESECFCGRRKRGQGRRTRFSNKISLYSVWESSPNQNIRWESMPTTAPFLLTLCLWILNFSLKCTCSSFYHRLFAREDSNHQVCITGLTQQRVHNVEELMEVFIYVGRRSEGEKSQWIVPLTNQLSITSSQNCVTESIFLQVVVISSFEMLKGIVTRMFLVDFAKL